VGFSSYIYRCCPSGYYYHRRRGHICSPSGYCQRGGSIYLLLPLRVQYCQRRGLRGVYLLLPLRILSDEGEIYLLLFRVLSDEGEIYLLPFMVLSDEGGVSTAPRGTTR
jgi:hypothetical protein